jgi:superfamily II DNA or RNA helicase
VARTPLRFDQAFPAHAGMNRQYRMAKRIVTGAHFDVHPQITVYPALIIRRRDDLLVTIVDDIPAMVAIGKDLLDADHETVGAVITTYNSARLYLDKLPEDRFQMLILDEAHKLRNLDGVERTPQVAQKFRKVLEDRRFRFVLMLTATPIQNRLWDLYSLVDLLTVARGHTNPFGSEGVFARRFIADKRYQARHLKPEAQEEFRSIVYSYMSRVRRGDAKLYFPDRIVQMQKVEPTQAELELVAMIAKPIQKLNRLVQISILQAMTSSPEALSAQLTNMARNGTVPTDLAVAVRDAVSRMPQSAKLRGLGKLVERLQRENPDRWRLVVFTNRRETQTTVQIFLENLGLKVGIINGDSGQHNQETIVKFRQAPPAHRVIVSTEAGSEGINLQVANMLVNYDLPWNPMIVEQRIGRVQRLASEHAHVSIFNMTLQGTFEEYIVGRLMEKLQMASHAVGDIEALLQGSDIGDGDGAESFEEKLLKLVLAALEGKDVEAETRLAEQSIEAAKAELEREEATINAMLGSMDGAEYVGPRAPKLPAPSRSMEVPDFTILALKTLGARVSPAGLGVHLVEQNGGREYIRFEEQYTPEVRSILYVPGSPAFQRLVSRVIASGLHEIADLDTNVEEVGQNIAQDWVLSFAGTFRSCDLIAGKRIFEGVALLRARAVVAHDSYERLIEARCSPALHSSLEGPKQLAPLSPRIEDASDIGLDVDRLQETVHGDNGIAEFTRFYLERREQEVLAAGNDERKRRKLQDDFTPRVEVILSGATGQVYRHVRAKVRFAFEDSPAYESTITISPHDGRLIEIPEMRRCSVLDRIVPAACLAACAISSREVLRHKLVASEASGRLALPEFVTRCAVSQKRVLQDEIELSVVTGRPVLKSLLKTSVQSGKRAEPEHFAACAFTGSEVLRSELTVSEISGRLYRTDEKAESALSGKTGHKQEFVVCHETRQTIARTEAEQCEQTGAYVRPGILDTCQVTGKKVLPSELGRCSVTGQRVLKRLLVTSSLSNTNLLESVALRSTSGKFCSPDEAGTCFWSGRRAHPDDLRECSLTGLPIHKDYATEGEKSSLQPLVRLLEGGSRPAEAGQLWEAVAAGIRRSLKSGKCQVQSALLSPTKRHLAACSEIKTLWGLRTSQAGAIYDIEDKAVVGRISTGKGHGGAWR